MNTAPRKIVIGDIHGCLKTFENLLARLDLQFQDELFLLGDYIDRGPDSKGVLDKVQALANEPFKLVALMGNHEQVLMSNYYAEVDKGWYDMADEEFLNSFNIPNLKEFPKAYIEFCANLPLYYIDDELLLVHAGLNFKSEEPLKDEKSMLWIRNWYDDLNISWLAGRTLVHGHTPLTKSDIELQFSFLNKLRVLNIDCGACFKEGIEHEVGYLCAYDHTNQQLYFEKNAD